MKINAKENGKKNVSRQLSRLLSFSYFACLRGDKRGKTLNLRVS